MSEAVVYMISTVFSVEKNQLVAEGLKRALMKGNRSIVVGKVTVLKGKFGP